MVYMVLGGHSHSVAHVWRSEDNFVESVFSCLCVGSRDQTRMVTRVWQVCYLMNHLTGPYAFWKTKLCYRVVMMLYILITSDDDIM